MILAIAAAAALTGCHATDGDTLRCGRERIRLIGIDAPEMPGHCRKGRQCAPGDPEASKRSLQQAMRQGPLSIDRIGHDRYGRTLAVVRAGSINLACWQLARGHAIYKLRWDDDRRTGKACALNKPVR